MRIILVRHGQTEWNRLGRFQGRSDIPLNKKGKVEALERAEALKKETISAFFTSPLTRAKETAQFIRALHPSAFFIIEEGLVEMNLGDFEGLTPGVWVTKYPHYVKKWRKTPASVRMPGGESLTDVQRRALIAVERIIHAYPLDSTLVLCSHNFVIGSILCHVGKVSLNHFRSFKQKTGGCKILRLNSERRDIAAITMD